MRTDSSGEMPPSARATTTSSVSETVSGGFFGGDPTGSVGGSISNSFSVSLADFKVVNYSTGAWVDHLIQMAASMGGPYNQPNDLVDMSVGGQFTRG